MARKTRKQRGGGGAGGVNGGGSSRRQRAGSNTNLITGIPAQPTSVYNYPASLITGIGSLFQGNPEKPPQAPTMYEEIQRLDGILQSQGSTNSVLRLTKEELDTIRFARQNRITLIAVNEYEKRAIEGSRANRRNLIDVTPEEIDIIEFVRKNQVRLERMQHLRRPGY